MVVTLDVDNGIKKAKAKSPVRQNIKNVHCISIEYSTADTMLYAHGVVGQNKEILLWTSSSDDSNGKAMVALEPEITQIIFTAEGGTSAKIIDIQDSEGACQIG